ncbi:hypothetical protein ACKKBG_A16445 [Auxenochlorella protothecoides x Auxenochlorella symbiontica]
MGDGIGRALAGEAGYQRLIRLVGRAFYAGECPPPVAIDPDALLPPTVSRFSKFSFAGLGVLLLDYLATRADGYCDEVTVCEDTRLSQKQVRRALKYLEDAGLVRCDVVKYSLARDKEPSDDPEVAARRRVETHAFWAVDYPRVKDALRLRLALMREALRKQAEDTDVLQQYICPRCGAQASSLDAVRLLDPRTGTFLCEECGAELEQRAAGDSQAGGPGGSAAGNKARQAAAKALQAAFERQLAPLIEQLERIKDADPPDPGSLQDWFLAQRDAAQRRKASLEGARRRAAGAGGAGAGEDGAGDLSVDQFMDLVDVASVEVKIGQGSSATGPGQALLPGKELPAWFRRPEQEGAGAGAATASAAAEDEARRRQIEAAYVAQYMESVRLAGLAGGEDVGALAAGDSPDAKRVKLEDVKGEAVAKAEAEANDAEEAAAAVQADFDWEDM